MDSARRFLLVRLDGIGDALACVPALEGLRRAFPDAAFGAVCSRANESLYARSRMEHVHVLASPDDEGSIEEQLRSAGYTDALVATEEPVGYKLALASRARRRSGFWHRFEKPFKSLWQFAHLTDAVYRPAAWVDRPEHEVSAVFALAERLGAQRPIPDAPEVLRGWLEVDETGSVHAGADAVAFQLAPKLCTNGWTPPAVARFAADALTASPFRRCVFMASPHDQGLAAEVMEDMPPGTIESGRFELAPPMNLSRWLGAIASAGALVSPDTGAAHAAGMLGVPVVDLFETAGFERLSHQWRPWAAPSRCLAKPAFSPASATSFASHVGEALAELALVAS